MKPYANDSDSEAIGELTIENRLDRVAIYGSIDLTRDQAGLQKALKLKALIDATIDALQGTPDLPDAVTAKHTEKKKNPFS